MTVISSFATVVSELIPEQLKRFAPTRVLVPLFVGATAIALIAAYVFGGKTLTEAWKERSALERLLATALLIFFFYLLALLLAAFQPALLRVYQGSWWGSRYQRNYYLDQWDRLSKAEGGWERLYRQIKENKLDFRLQQSRDPVPGSSRAYRTFEIIRNEAWIETSGTAVAVASRPIARGEEPGPSAWFTIPDASWLEGMSIVSVRLPDDRITPLLAAGSTVIAQKRDGTVVNHGGSLVLAVSRSEFSPVATVVLAAPDHVCAALMDESQSVSLLERTTGLTYPVWTEDPDPKPRTRRWLPLNYSSDLSAGDYVEITFDDPPHQPLSAIFCGFADGGGVFALTIPDAQAKPVRSGQFATWTRSQLPYFVFGPEFKKTGYLFPIEVNTGNTDHVVGVNGTVRAGKLYDATGEGVLTDVVPGSLDLSGHCLKRSSPQTDHIRFDDIRPRPNEPGFRAVKLTGYRLPPNLQNETDVTLVSLIPVQKDEKRVNVLAMKFLTRDNGGLGLVKADNATCQTLEKNDTAKWIVEADLSEWMRSGGNAIEYRARSQAVVGSNWKSDAEHIVVYGFCDEEGKHGGSIPFAVDTVVLPSEKKDIRIMVCACPRSTVGARPRVCDVEQFLESMPVLQRFDRENFKVGSPIGAASDELAKESRFLLKSMIAQRLGAAEARLDPRTANKRYFGETHEHLFLTVVDTLDKQRKAFRLQFPRIRGEVAATKLGNIIAAVHSYAHETYGIDATLVLPRLVTVLSGESQSRIRDAEDRMALIMWTGFFTLLTGVSGSLLFAYGGMEVQSLATLVGCLLFFGLLIYPAAVSSAFAYGDQLRIAFDSERGAVLSKLGIKVPVDEEGLTTSWQESGLWENIGQWWEYGYRREAPPAHSIPGVLASSAEASSGETE